MLESCCATVIDDFFTVDQKKVCTNMKNNAALFKYTREYLWNTYQDVLGAISYIDKKASKKKSNCVLIK
jgi:hypothetical protein